MISMDIGVSVATMFSLGLVRFATSPNCPEPSKLKSMDWIWNDLGPRIARSDFPRHAVSPSPLSIFVDGNSRESSVVELEISDEAGLLRERR